MPCYTNNTDVELGLAACGGGLHSHPITHHTEEAFVGAGATLSAPLFWLSLHAPVPKQIRVCEGFEWDPGVTLRKPVSLLARHATDRPAACPAHIQRPLSDEAKHDYKYGHRCAFCFPV